MSTPGENAIGSFKQCIDHHSPSLEIWDGEIGSPSMGTGVYLFSSLLKRTCCSFFFKLMKHLVSR